MKQSKRQREIEARKAADPLAQALGRTDIDYESDDLPTAPRNAIKEILSHVPPCAEAESCAFCSPVPLNCSTCQKPIGLKDDECTGWHPAFKCDCGFESSVGAEYRFCPMCGKARPVEIFNDGIIQGRI